MVIQLLLYVIGQAYTWLISWELPNETWQLLQSGSNAFSVIVGYLPKIPYIPYSDVTVAAGFYMVIYVASIIIGLIAAVMNVLFRMRG